MHYDFNQVALDLPQSLRDETTYNFEDRDGGGETLSIVAEPPEPRMSPAEVVRSLAKPIGEGMGPLTLVAGTDVVFLGQPAHQAHYELGLRGGSLQIFFLVAAGPNATTVVRRMSPAADAGAIARFDDLVRSARPAVQSWSRAAAPGFVRHQAGLLTWEVPGGLAPPSSFVFAAERDAVRLTLEYLEQPVSTEPLVFEDFVAPERDGEALTIETKDEQRFANAVFQGWAGRFDLAWLVGKQRVRETLLRQLQISVTDDLTFRITGVATSALGHGLDTIWSQVEATLVRGK